MKFFDTTVYLPVGQYDMSVTTDEPRIPTAFEWQIVQVIDQLQRANIASGVTVIDVFRTVLGCEGVETFVKTALSELFSSTVDVLRTDNHRVPFEQLTISEINLTEEGRHLLKSGWLPSAPRTEKREVFFDFARNAIVPVGRRGIRSDSDSPDKLPLALVAGVPAPVEMFRAEVEKELSEGSRIRDISPLPVIERTYFWRAQRVSFSIENGTITLDPISPDANDRTVRFLRDLTPEIAQKLFFEKPFAATSVNIPTSVMELLREKILSIRPASEVVPGEIRPAPITARLVETPMHDFQSGILDVVFSEDTEECCEVQEIADTGVFKLTVRGNPCALQPGSVTDGNTVRSLMRVRCYYGGMPLELPVRIESQIDLTRSTQLHRVINEALLSVPKVDRYTIGYLLSSTTSERAKLLALVRLSEADAAAQIYNNLLKVLKRRKSSTSEARVVDEIFSSMKMDTIKGIRSTFDLLRKLDVTAETKKQFMDTMRKRLCQFSVDSPAVWIECVTLYKELGGKWTFDEKSPVVRILSSPNVSSGECTAVKNTLKELDGRVAWLDVARAVLKNGNVRLSPDRYVERAKALSTGDADLMGEMMKWFIHLSDWKKGFASESERDAFFAKYGLKLPNLPKGEKKNEFV